MLPSQVQKLAQKTDSLSSWWAVRTRPLRRFSRCSRRWASWSSTSGRPARGRRRRSDRKSTRLNSSHLGISYAVFCLKKKGLELIQLAKDMLVVEVIVDARWAAGFEGRGQNGLALRKSLLFFNDAATAEIYPLSLHDALPI